VKRLIQVCPQNTEVKIPTKAVIWRDIAAADDKKEYIIEASQVGSGHGEER
jgi:hypothetical protein